MLIFKVFVNSKPINEIHVANIGRVTAGEHAYRIIHPMDYAHLGPIVHERREGHMVLFEKVARAINEADGE
ncbi:hypothetical protein K8I61_00845 [bacterium]|nr:hypothetical protein [bacterium]